MLIDAADVLAVLNGGRWAPLGKENTTYVVGHREGRQIRLHRYLLDVLDSPFQVDHIDGDGLNNRRANLRLATVVENGRNRSKSRTKRSSSFKGVYPGRRTGWRVRLQINGKALNVGTFPTEDAAARAYDDACRHHFGAFAKPNATTEAV